MSEQTQEPDYFSCHFEGLLKDQWRQWDISTVEWLRSMSKHQFTVLYYRVCEEILRRAYGADEAKKMRVSMQAQESCNPEHHAAIFAALCEHCVKGNNGAN